jgi:hypothetical protein
LRPRISSFLAKLAEKDLGFRDRLKLSIFQTESSLVLFTFMEDVPADPRQEMERLSRLIEEGERAIVRQLGELIQMSGPVLIEAQTSLLIMIDTLSVVRQRFDATRAILTNQNSSE